MKVYLVYAIRSCSGHYVTFEMMTTDLQAAIDHYKLLKAGGGNQEDYPRFDWEELQLENQPTSQQQERVQT